MMGVLVCAESSGPKAGSRRALFSAKAEVLEAVRASKVSTLAPNILRGDLASPVIELPLRLHPKADVLKATVTC